jgi:hypothetical protein
MMKRRQFFAASTCGIVVLTIPGVALADDDHIQYWNPSNNPSHSGYYGESLENILLLLKKLNKRWTRTKFSIGDEVTFLEQALGIFNAWYPCTKVSFDETKHIHVWEDHLVNYAMMIGWVHNDIFTRKYAPDNEYLSNFTLKPQCKCMVTYDDLLESTWEPAISDQEKLIRDTKYSWAKRNNIKAPYIIHVGL